MRNPMRKYEVNCEGWVTDTVFVTAANKVEAIEEATIEFKAMKGATSIRTTKIEEIEND
jgi:hypothetical protein